MRVEPGPKQPAILPKFEENTLSVRFTANAINYLSVTVFPINLKDWVWHEETINGIACYIITDRVPEIAS